jgi:uncharacterized protein YraI
MASLIDPTKPTSGSAYTADVQANFATAASEISALQDAVAGPAGGSTSIGSGPTTMYMTVGAGIPDGSTVGFDRVGSQYTDTTGSPGAILYLSGGDGTWVAIG